MHFIPEFQAYNQQLFSVSLAIALVVMQTSNNQNYVKFQYFIMPLLKPEHVVHSSKLQQLVVVLKLASFSFHIEHADTH